MLLWRWHTLAALATLGRAAVLHSPGRFTAPLDLSGNASMPLLARQEADEGIDPTDLSFITNLAAIGDSYSAGIGAGERLGVPNMIALGETYSQYIKRVGGTVKFDAPREDWDCSRYEGSYPYLINHDERLGDSSKRIFQFESCSGAVIKDVVEKQIPRLSANQQVILLSAGGNDALLLEILNQCVYQVFVISSLKVMLAKLEIDGKLKEGKLQWAKDIDWDDLSRGCDGQLDLVEKLVASDSFASKVDSVINAAKPKLVPGGMIYYTGYAKFFDESTDECDKVTWRSWTSSIDGAGDVPVAYLTVERRKRMNKLVESVNAQISAAVDRAGSSVKFVDYDKYVGEFNGRFCEPGVDESIKESNTRPDLMFYKLDYADPFGLSPWKRTIQLEHLQTFQGSMEQLAYLAKYFDPDIRYAQEDYITDNVNSTDLVHRNLLGDIALMIGKGILPDGYGRVFHPQVRLHELIANLVIYHMVDKNAQDHGDIGVPEVLAMDACVRYPETIAPSEAGQQVAIASYINPLADPDAWNRLIGYPKDKVSVLIANVVNGPDTAVDDSWKRVIDRAAASGKTVLGYVRTGYLGVSQQKFTTRLGSTDLADWTAQIEEDVDMWYKLYGDSMGGIFFDEGWNDCGPDNVYADLYSYINDYTKRKHPGALTVLNPGATMPQCFEHTMDTLMTFENSYQAYTESYTPNTWSSSDMRKLWHIIYDVPESEVGRIAELARQRGVGLIEITNDVMPNPYDNLPAESYMQEMIRAVEGGIPLNDLPSPYPTGDAVSAPGGLEVVRSDYSSAHLRWSPVAKAVGYHVYLAGSPKQTSYEQVVVNVPGGMTEVTVGNLAPGTANSFTVTAVGGEGEQSSFSKTVTVITDSLPDGKTVTNYKAIPGARNTEYQANILVPYAFVRLYIWSGVGCDWKSSPGWPVNFLVDQYVCAQFMVEGSTLYAYTGTLPEGSTNAPWSWTSIGSVDVTVEGYTYKWILPVGLSTTDTTKFVVQAQGYGPYINVFQPDPNDVGSEPEPDPQPEPEPEPEPPRSQQDPNDSSPEDFDCKGSSQCKSNLVQYCNHAVNELLLRNDDLNYGTFGDRDSGTCYGSGVNGGACGIFIQKGSECEISGNDLWWAYQNIRDKAGCDICGSWHRKDGCLVTVNYVTGCKNVGS